MRQILQSLRTGEIEVAKVPCPAARPHHLLTRTRVSLISAGTERALLSFGRAGWLEKARQQPDKVRQVIDKVRTDGLLETMDSVQSKLAAPLPLGYCNVGSVIEVGTHVQGIQIGDRVVSNGHHAEVVCVPRNLTAVIPDGVADEAASFTVVGAIGLQGIRLAAPTLGETFAVTGLGLIGLLTVQLLRAHGCRVLGLDVDPHRLELARQFGAETCQVGDGGDPVGAALAYTQGHGVDGVLITASTRSSGPVHEAAQMCRKRGRIVLVGVTGLELSRADFYEKELSFQVSCSYGPGRYDASYERDGADYPLAHARWTAQRNFEAVLAMMADGRLDTQSLMTHRFDLAETASAYELVAAGDPRSLGILLDYPSCEELTAEELQQRTVRTTTNARGSRPGLRFVPARRESSPATQANGVPRVAFIGAGAFACRTLIPSFQKAGAILTTIAAPSGVSALIAGRRFRFEQATSDVESVLDDESLDAIIIATRHDSHADLVCRALEHGKHVYVEKPLAISEPQLECVIAALKRTAVRGCSPLLMVGFNRRFAPHLQQIVPLLRAVDEPKAMVMTINAGPLPQESWVHDPSVGGGRIAGEACHFIDLLRHLCGHPIIAVQATGIEADRVTPARRDCMTITLSFADGSTGTIHYLANGHRALAKERLEVFVAGRVIQLDNFRRLRTFGCQAPGRKWLWRQDKGHRAAAAAFINAVRGGGASPIPIREILEVTAATLDVLSAAAAGATVRCGDRASQQSNTTAPTFDLRLRAA